MLNLDITIRKLAKCNYYQTIYSQEKNLGIHLFRNNSDLIYCQIVFLGYLSLYSALYFDFHMGEVDERVFKNNIREDSYMYFKRQNKVKAKAQKDKPTNPIKQPSKPVTSQWVFTTPKKVK